MLKFYLILILTILTYNSLSQKNDYDFSCFEEDIFDLFIGASSDVEKNMLNILNINVSLKDEVDVGNRLLSEQKKKHTIISSGEEYNLLKQITKQLSDSIINPRGFKYSIHYIESSDIFAFTAGGRIFYSSGLLSLNKEQSIMAAIISHEMAHNELMHINNSIKRYLVANQFDTIGDIVGSVGKILTKSLNQKDEIHCDFYGVNLAFKAGYKPCDLASFWELMNSQSTNNEGIYKFISSHPNPMKRKQCIKNHIDINFTKTCD